MRHSSSIILLFLCLSLAHCFFLSRRPSRSQQGRSPPLPRRDRVVSLSSTFDYEYIPSRGRYETDLETNSHGEDSFSRLRSCYPPGTPAGLRGEAVRSALKSSQCIAWNFQQQDLSNKGTTALEQSASLESLEFGWVRVEGEGCRTFLQNKLTQSFLPKEDDNDDDDAAATSRPNLSSGASALVGSFQEACLLTAKGRLIDRIGIALLEETNTNDDEFKQATTTAFLVTSPGHSSHDLFQRLDPFVFPFDKVTLYDDCSDKENPCFIFTVASTRREHVQSVFDKQILSLLRQEEGWNVPSHVMLPTDQQCLLLQFGKYLKSQCLILPSQQLAPAAAIAHTFCFSRDAAAVGNRIWQHLVADGNPQGPVEIGEREFESLRIESGQAAFGKEMTANRVTVKKKHPVKQDHDVPNKDETANTTSATTTKDNEKKNQGDSPTAASPLELHYQALIDWEKGCYLGQEGVTSIMKNPRGPPRSLYHVIFHDDFNIYEHQSRKDESFGGEKTKRESSALPIINDISAPQKSMSDNLTRAPRPGDALFALGSNEEILVGTITSVAEPGATGDPITIALALVRRADSILKQMKDRDLQIPASMSKQYSMENEQERRWENMASASRNNKLDGLEVIIGGTFTIGRLKLVPSRYRNQVDVAILFEDGPDYKNDDAPFENDECETHFSELFKEEGGSQIVDAQTEEWQDPWDAVDEPKVDANKDSKIDGRTDPDILAKAEKEQEEVDATAAEARRKAEKLEFLKKQAEAALARRKSKNSS